MSREIKFKVYDNKRGYFLPTNDGLVFSCKNEIDNLYGSFTVVTALQKKYFIILQFTGLTDKNGQDIYEGDIVKWDAHIPIGGYNTHNFEVIYQEPTFNGKQLSGFLLEIIGSNRPFIQTCGSNSPRQLEIIGNIFDNKELLEANNLVEIKEKSDLDLDKCSQCNEEAWDGYICHNCGLKNI